MRLATWNCCRGQWTKKVPLLQSIAADITVIQECPRPVAESVSCLWFGDNERQGIAVLASPPYSLRRLPSLPDVPKYIVPVAVDGPTEFLMLAVWSKGGQKHSYVEAVVQAVTLYRDLLETRPAVLIGDLNSNVIWDATHPQSHNHTALVALLAELKMVSAYHHYFGEEHGAETRPTYFFHWKEQRPYHIDYCFIPEAWVKNLLRVEVGSYEDWKLYSDHRPLTVELHPSAA